MKCSDILQQGYVTENTNAKYATLLEYTCSYCYYYFLIFLLLSFEMAHCNVNVIEM